MAVLSLDTDIRNDLLDGIDSVFNSGTVKIYADTIPTDADTAVGAQTLLATVDIDADAFNAASSGAKTKQGTWQEASAIATGTAAWFRMANGADSRRIDGDVTVSAGGGTLELDSVSITSGQVVTITTFTLNMPAS